MQDRITRETCKFFAKNRRPYDPAHKPDYAASRAAEDARFSRFAPPEGVTVEAGLAGTCPAEFVTGGTNPKNRAVLYVHGGGHVGGSPKSRRPLTFELAGRHGLNVIALDYPLAPEAPYPADLDTCLSAYVWALDRYGAQGVALMGESAGATKVLGLIHKLLDEDLPVPACAVVASPPVWLHARKPDPGVSDPIVDDSTITEIIAAYLQGNKDLLGCPYVEPLARSLVGFPPLLVNYSDIEYLREDSKAAIAAATAAGVKVTEVVGHDVLHTYILDPRVPQAQVALEQIASFIRQRWPV